MNPSDRIKCIKKIARELVKEEWVMLDLTLQEFGLSTTSQWSGDKESYVVEMLVSADSDTLQELVKHSGESTRLTLPEESSFWKQEEARIFLSHLAKYKVETSQLKDQLALFGISSFVAHEDIEPTKEWQSEIELALASMDGFIALLTPGFENSKWCDQEVGVAIGMNLPIIPIRIGLDPYGFIGKYQAIQGLNKSADQLAQEIFEILIVLPKIGSKITDFLVAQLLESGSFYESRLLFDRIKLSEYVTNNHVLKMENAIVSNSQISGAWGVSEEIAQLAQQIRE